MKQTDTDQWKGYIPLMKDWNRVQTKNDPFVNFNLRHRFIQQLKGWLGGIHHHVSKEYIQTYLDEYSYRFNRNRTRDSIFNNLINRMVNQKAVCHRLLVSK